jgi:hypothetical protein
MDKEIYELVRTRANEACEYCRLPERCLIIPFEIEHVVPAQHGGADVPSNLAFACLHCNRHKGPNLAGIDRQTSRTRLVRLFNPRRHSWHRHFRWDGPRIFGRTPIGRVTVELLAMNDQLRVELREELMEEGVFQPEE